MSERRPTFEEAFGGLQSTIEALEQGGLSLEEALDLFERGMLLAGACKESLDHAELRLTRLLEQHEPLFEAGLLDES